jgi:LysM repeat protein
MGQLERYGLYVLCLVIFLILGVAIWGGDPVAGVPQTVLQDSAAQAVQAPPAEDFFAQVRDAKPVNDDLLGIVSAVTTTGDKPAPADAGAHKSTPTTEPASVTPSFKSYVVKDNDSLERIARRELGSVKHLDRLRELNPDVDPKRMRIGSVLRLPTITAGAEPAAAQTTTPATAKASSSSYKVKPGDSPWTISQAVFGTNAYAKEILELNGIRDARRLKVGAVLKMPAPR